jgi:hypothetical protein
MLATVVGWVIGGIWILLFVAENSSDVISQALPILHEINFSFSAFVGFFSFGLVVGGAQFLALRKQLHKPWLWIIATAIGYGVGIVFIKEMISKPGIEWIQWFVIALIQWIYLYRQLSRSFYWILFNSFISFILLISAFLRNSEPNINTSQVEEVSAIVLIAGGIGLLAGICMWWILQGPRKQYEGAA